MFAVYKTTLGTEYTSTNTTVPVFKDFMSGDMSIIAALGRLKQEDHLSPGV
jgi:hypothetical protein